MPAEAAYFFLQQNDLGVGRGRQDRASSGWSRGTGYGLFCFLFAIHNFVNVYVKVINAHLETSEKKLYVCMRVSWEGILACP